MRARAQGPLGLLLLALFTGCAESDGLGNEGVDARADARMDASDTGARTDSADVVSTPLGDAIPSGAVSYSRASACPLGWAPWTEGAGRTVVPLPQGGTRGGVQGMPLNNAESRAHGHTASAMVLVPAVSFAGIAGSGMALGAAGMVPLALTVAGAEAGLPYVQLLACRKRDEADSRVPAAPRNMVLFFDRPDCPAGWSEAAALRGRLVVGTPMGGTHGAAFGGMPLGDREARGHTHALAATATPTPQGIALASGCCGDGFAQNAPYPVMATSAAESAAPPYVQLLACTPN